MIFLVHLEVLRQSANAFAEQGDLNFRAARVGGMRSILIDDGSLLLSG